VPLTDTIFQPISVLVADSSQMQSQLLTGALRRRPDFKVTACEMDADAILHLLLSTRAMSSCSTLATTVKPVSREPVVST